MNRIVVFVAFMISSASPILAQTARELTQKAMELYESRDYTEALLNLNQAIEKDRNYAQAYYVRGNIKVTFEDFHGAMKDYNIALEKDSKFADGYFARGNIKLNLQDYYGAIADYSSAIALRENYVEAYYNRGKAKQFLQAYEDAINDCTKIIQINPKSVDAYYMRGLLRINFGDQTNGCLDLSKAGELGDLKAYEAIKDKCNQKGEDKID